MGIFDWRVKKRGAPTPPAPVRAKRAPEPTPPSEPPRNALSPLWSSWPTEPKPAPSKVPAAAPTSEPPQPTRAPSAAPAAPFSAPSAAPTPAPASAPRSFVPPPLGDGEPAVGVTRARPLSDPAPSPTPQRASAHHAPHGSSFAQAAEARSPGSAMRVAMQSSDWESALAVAQSLLAENPAHADARAVAERCQQQLLGIYTRRLGARERVLRVTVPDTWLAQLAIDPRAAFLLSRIDGTCTIEEVIDMSCMPELDAMGLLVDMLEEGVIEASVRQPSIRPPR